MVVLLNDCGTDDTVTVARRHWRSRVPCEVWDNPANLKERRTTNAAIERLAGIVDWTFILHADDVVKPNWLSLYINEITNAPASVISICSSHVGAANDLVVNGRTGLGVPHGDVAALAAAMTRFARDPDLAGTMGAAARQHVMQDYSITRAVERTCEATGKTEIVLGRGDAALTASPARVFSSGSAMRQLKPRQSARTQ